MTTGPKHLMGLPEELPGGEAILWQGKPAWRSFALQAFHVRKIAIYFGLLLTWRAAMGLYERVSLQSFATDIAPLVLLALASIALSALLAWVYCRTTTYTITNRRVFMRFGAALPMMLNLPFNVVGTAAAKVHRDGTADIPLQMTGSNRVAYLQLWPHARPWHLRNPEPMIRSIPDGARVAAMLASALAASPPPVSQTARVAPSENTETRNVPVLSTAAA